MAEPSEKHPDLVKFLDNLLKIAGKMERTKAIPADICISCGGDAIEFRDPLSQREYSISGLCQKCQDSVFGASDED